MIRLILLTDFTEAYAHNLLKGILKYSKNTSPWVVCRMPPSYKDTYGLSGVIKWAKRWGANAIIGQFNPTDNVDLFRQNGIVAIAQDFKSRFSAIPNITSEYEKTGRMAADFFLQKGFKSFAFYGYKNVVWSEERCLGFRERITEKGFGDSFYEFQKQSLASLWYYKSEPVIEWIKSLPYPVALMACDDTQANKIMEVCRVLNIQIPEQIAVLGVDNDEMICNLSDPPLSSVSLDIVNGGYQAAELIDKLIHDPSAEHHDVVILPSVIANRLSTDIYSTSDVHILKVLKYIHTNLSIKINVKDVLKLVPLSRRLLEIRFKQVTGKSVYQYISDLRMERFSELLIKSKDTIADTAMAIGLSDYKNLARQFKQKKGITPNELRKQHKIK